jgi:transglutaminase-like putative cysteine protease
LAAQAGYEVTLLKRDLKEGKPPLPPLLDSTQRRVYTSATEEYDFKSEPFATWLQTNHLLRKDRESNLAFGFRALKTLSQALKYKGKTGIEKASTICTRGDGACGGLSNVYVAILRANGIPARVLYGRLAKNSSRPNDPATYHCPGLPHLNSRS